MTSTFEPRDAGMLGAPGAPWAVGIVVPAHDEERLVGRCVRSLRRALLHAGAGRAWIVVVADRCTDRTAYVAERALRNAGEVLPCTSASVGLARRAGVDAIIAHFAEVSPRRLWILNTDADTVVPPDWIARQLAIADRGASAIAGIVQVDSFVEHPPWAAQRFADTYVLGDDDSHGHVHGANLGVRADAYLDVGGFADRTLAEDHCIWGRLTGSGWPVVATTRSVVTTSGRLVGRAPGGFADALRTTCETAA